MYNVFPPSIIELEQEEETNEFFLYFLSSWEDFTTEDRISIKEFENDIHLFLKFYDLSMIFENNSISDSENHLVHFNFKTIIHEDKYIEKYKLVNMKKLNNFKTEILNPMRNKTITRIKSAIIVSEVLGDEFYYIGNTKHKELEKKNKEEISIIKINFKNSSSEVNFGY